MVFPVAPFDPYTRWLTSGLAYVGGALLLPLLFALISNMRWFGLLIPTAVALAVGLFLLLAYAGQPLFYQITDEHLLVKRRWLWAIKVPLADITGVSLAPKLSGIPRVGLRFAFNPGIFGYQGVYYLLTTSRVFFMATNRERLVAVACLSAMPIILSPLRPQPFIESLNEHCAIARDKARSQQQNPPDRS